MRNKRVERLRAFTKEIIGDDWTDAARAAALEARRAAAGKAEPDGSQYHGIAYGKGAKVLANVGPHPTRMAAAVAAFEAAPKAKSVTTGYGNGGAYGDLRSHDPLHAGEVR
jgi:hypothetical protein